MAYTTCIQTASDLWQALIRQAGLELELKSGPPRDAELQDQVILTLRKAGNLPQQGVDLASMLAADAVKAHPTVGVEALVIALLESQRGFGAMMSDILATLETANACIGDDNLEIAFDFGAMLPSVRGKLEHFRKIVETVRQIQATQFFFSADRSLYDLLRTLYDHTQVPYMQGMPPLVVRSTLARTGVTDADTLLDGLSELLDHFLAECQSPNGDRQRLAASLFAKGDAGAITLRGLVLEGFDVRIAASLAMIHERVRQAGSISPQLLSDVNAQLQQIPRRSVWLQQKVRALLDVLNLPVWKKRHELYSVWAGCMLLDTICGQADSMHYHPVDGVLSFGFSGKQLASYTYDGGSFEVHCELRTPLVGTSAKRALAIQPDFRVLTAPGVGAAPASAADRTLLVQEVKHYLYANAQNFTVAAQDYARSCPQATVFVVNHGPADHAKLLMSVHLTLQGRTRFLGGIRPETASQTRRLHQDISAILFKPRQLTAAAVSPNGQTASISLCWGHGLGDMDLALSMGDGQQVAHEVSYQFLGHLSQAPFAALRKDVRHAPGTETIDIAQWAYPVYQVKATQYDTADPLEESRLSCRLVVDGKGWLLRCNAAPGARDWHVATIDMVNGRPVVRPA